MLFFVKYELINFRSPNQYTISIDLLSIRISIRISKQSKHKDQQAKGLRESALSCIKKYALCCTIDYWYGHSEGRGGEKSRGNYTNKGYKFRISKCYQCLLSSLHRQQSPDNRKILLDCTQINVKKPF